jgi:SAM-dependent methyltransferase
MSIIEPDKLLEFIHGELKPKKKEKKENGEVFTPLSLVNEMLDKLDEAYTKENGKSIFTELTLKWLDPAVGIGNFPIIVYQRLMKGLKMPEEDRRKHILEQMIYSVELNPKNVFIYKKIFCGDKYKLNIYEGNTLKMDMKKEFKLPPDFIGFDVVMGNPPFQEKVGSNKTEPLWNKFIKHALTILKPSGYLVYVHPSGWRNINGKFKNIQRDILSRDLQYLEIHNEKDGLKTFSSSTRYDWYVLKNEIIDTTKTIIKFQDGTTNIINVNGLEFIPNGEYETIMSMIAKPNEENVNVIYSRSLYGTDKKHMSRTKTDDYPCVYTVNSKSEITYYYSSKQHGHFGVPKLIWSNGGNTGSYIDIGDYGLTQFAYAIIDHPENLPKIKEVFDSKEFRKLMELCAVGQFSVNYKVISIFKKDFWKVFLE